MKNQQSISISSVNGGCDTHMNEVEYENLFWHISELSVSHFSVVVVVMFYIYLHSISFTYESTTRNIISISSQNFPFVPVKASRERIKMRDKYLQ